MSMPARKEHDGAKSKQERTAAPLFTTLRTPDRAGSSVPGDIFVIKHTLRCPRTAWIGALDEPRW
jgi:hypothetical protein